MSSSRHTLRPAHAPQVAYRDPVFLESKVARPLRILGEYLHPLVQLRQEGIGDTIVMFGSARIGSREAAAARLARLKQTRTARFSGGRQKQHRAALREARSALEMSRYYEEARELSRRITAWSMTLGEHPRRFVICYGRRFWDEVLNWRAMLRWGVIDDEEYGLLQFADTVDQAFERVRSRLEKYHMKLDTDLEE